MIRQAKHGKVGEIGCGRAQILTSGQVDPTNYTGCDFSSEMLAQNRHDFPQATFRTVQGDRPLPFEDASAEVVLSVFVLEHVVWPARFLSDLARICKPGGRIVMLCPDYYSRLSMASQIIGHGIDSGMQKLKRGHVVDAVWSSWVARWLLPAYLKKRLRGASDDPVFLMNANPSCFSRPFYPDADAVYVTHFGEIKRTLLGHGCCHRPDWIDPDARLLASQRRLIYSVFEKSTRMNQGTQSSQSSHD